MPDQLHYLDVTDFRPGIVSDYRAPVSAGITQDLPPGTAAEGTVRCIALTTGALAPLPALSATLTADLPTVTLAGSVTPAVYKPIGLWSLGPMWKNDGVAVPTQSADFQDEIHVAYEFISTAAGVFHRNLIWAVIKAYMPTIPSPTTITKTGASYASAPNLTISSRGMSHTITRARDADFEYPGYPCVFTEWADTPPYQTGDAVWYVWPNPTIAGLPTDTPYSQAVTFNGNGIYCATVIGHQGRVIFLLDSKFDHGLNGQFLSNEQFGATDPPNSLPPTNNFASPFAPTLTPIFSLDPQQPGGYGSWGSISFGELMLIKRAGGALHVLGDILGTNTLVTRMAGVTPTGNLTNRASQTPNGLVYCVDNDGAYIWNGDNVSHKVSKLADRFYDRTDGNPSAGIFIRHAPWGDWVVFPNNWLYDTLTDSWWQLEAPATYTSVMVAESMAATRLLYTVAADNTGQVSVFDRLQPASTYVWVSHPIQVTEQTLIDVLDVEVGVSHNASILGEVDVQVELADGSFSGGSAFHFTAISTTIQRLRLPLAARHLPHIRLKVTVKGDVAGKGPAPVLSEIKVGWVDTGTPKGQNV